MTNVTSDQRLRLDNRFAESNTWRAGTQRVDDDGTVSAVNDNRGLRQTVGTVADLTAPVYALHIVCVDHNNIPCTVYECDRLLSGGTLYSDIYGPGDWHRRAMHLTGWDAVMAAIRDIDDVARITCSVNNMPFALAAYLSSLATD